MKTPCFLSWCSRRLLTVCLALVPVASALASDFQVNPVRLDLNGKTRTALLAVTNSSSEPVRLQVTVYSWRQDTSGKMELLPSQDLSLFPSLLTLEGHQSRNIRIGSPLTGGASEKAYRVIVEQMPSQTSSESGGSRITVLTRMSIPVFIAPAKASPQSRVENLEFAEGKVSFQLHNSGNTHVFARQARVQGLDAEGKALLDQSQTGWYVLAGDARQFSLELPGDLCRRLKKLSVEVTTDTGTFPATATVSGDRCGT
jgi:fimbrial chaperone protein